MKRIHSDSASMMTSRSALLSGRVGSSINSMFPVRKSQILGAGSQDDAFRVAALPWLISFNARQQVFFQPGPALLEPFNFRLMTSFRLVTD